MVLRHAPLDARRPVADPPGGGRKAVLRLPLHRRAVRLAGFLRPTSTHFSRSRLVFGVARMSVSLREIDIQGNQHRQQEQHPVVAQHGAQHSLCPEQLRRRTVGMNAEQRADFLVRQAVKDREFENLPVARRQTVDGRQQQPQLHALPLFIRPLLDFQVDVRQGNGMVFRALKILQGQVSHDGHHPSFQLRVVFQIADCREDDDESVVQDVFRRPLVPYIVATYAQKSVGVCRIKFCEGVLVPAFAGVYLYHVNFNKISLSFYSRSGGGSKDCTRFRVFAYFNSRGPSRFVPRVSFAKIGK